jgi:hypothetical protein
MRIGAEMRRRRGGGEIDVLGLSLRDFGYNTPIQEQFHDL